MDWKKKCKDLDTELFPDSKPLQQKPQRGGFNKPQGPKTTYNSFAPRREKRKYEQDKPEYDQNYKRSR